MRGDVPPLSVSPQNKQGNVCLGHETGMPWSPGDVRFPAAVESNADLSAFRPRLGHPLGTNA